VQAVNRHSASKGVDHCSNWADASVELGGADGPAAESITTDIHCVTRWSKLDTAWRGISVDTLLADVETEADYAMAHS
jgi:hypothetical protein